MVLNNIPGKLTHSWTSDEGKRTADDDDAFWPGPVDELAENRSWPVIGGDK